MNIYVVTHKKARMPKDPLYIPIQVGSGPDLYPLRDNTQDQIADKNPHFCELTAMYWIWKNVNSDIVGIAHYRRYMTRGMFSYRLLREEDIRGYLSRYDLLIPKPLCMRNETVLAQFSEKHNPDDLAACRDVISSLSPEYTEDFDRVLQKHYFFQYNMIIAGKPLYDRYMAWLFPILFDLEKKIRIEQYDGYNQRLFGFLSERLLDVWLTHNDGIRYREMPYINTETADWTFRIRNLKNAVKERYVKSRYRE